MKKSLIVKVAIVFIIIALFSVSKTHAVENNIPCYLMYVESQNETHYTKVTIED